MTTEAESLPVNEVNDQQVEKFFETGGQEAPEETKEAPKVEPKAEETKTEQVKEERVVPLAALHEERTRRKEMQAKIDKMEQTFQKLMAEQQQRQQPQAPAFEEDPANHLRHSQEEIRRQIDQQNAWIQQQHQQAEQSRQTKTVINQYRASAMDFAKEKPDFTQAYQYLVDNRQAEYEAAGYTKQEALYFAEQDELGIVQKALYDEANPAERIYKLAAVRGYRAPEPKKEEPNKLENIEKGLQASKTLSNAGGQSPKGLTLESLADLEGEEFDKAWAKLIG